MESTVFFQCFGAGSKLICCDYLLFWRRGWHRLFNTTASSNVIQHQRIQALHVVFAAIAGHRGKPHRWGREVVTLKTTSEFPSDKSRWIRWKKQWVFWLYCICICIYIYKVRYKHISATSQGHIRLILTTSIKWEPFDRVPSQGESNKLRWYAQPGENRQFGESFVFVNVLFFKIWLKTVPGC